MKERLYMNFLGPLSFALIAAVGNALFVIGQRKSAAMPALLVSFISMLVASIIMIVMILVSNNLPSKDSLLQYRGLSKWLIMSGIGQVLISVGFAILYGRYGANNFVLYAVSSIFITVVFVGGLVFKETLHTYHIISLVFAILAIAFFTMGNSKIAG
jgi:drug/metabolite transporter (DMT)-like permease